jgi:signal transduction histidine kinase
MLEQALYSFDCTIKGNQIIKFRYTFQPFEQMTRVTAREIVYPFVANLTTNNRPLNSIPPTRDRGFEKARWLVREEKDEKTGEKRIEHISLDDVGIGEIRFHGYAFDRELKTLTLATIDPIILREYLKINGGVRVYRDGVRVYDYGEPGNDWLNLQARRVARPGVKLDSNLLVAAVELERSTSKTLVEKTNREGFVETAAYHTLVEVILQCLDRVENYRYEDKERIRLNYGVSNRKDRVPLTDRLSEARALIERKISDPADKTALVTALTRVEDDYEFISTTLLTSAGAGMQLGLAVHEIEKIVDELTAFVARDAVPVRVRDLVRRLSQLVERYSTILRRGNKREADLKSIIRDAAFFTEYRLQVHKVELIKPFEIFIGNSKVKCIDNLITTGVLNLIDNSLFWLDYAKISPKRILIDLRETSTGDISVVVADNGTGFNLPPELMIRPFISKRPKGSGLGLYLLDEIMTIHAGTLTFPDAKNMGLPSDFANGAVAVLTFNKEDRKI